MPKEATIRIRCSAALKAKLEAIADGREQTLSDFVRTVIIDALDQDGFEPSKKNTPGPNGPRLLPRDRDRSA